MTKTIRLLALAVLLLTGIAGIPGVVFARGVKGWSYQELLEKSDLVVIATPTGTTDTKEDTGIMGQHAIGVETKFTVLAVLKNDKGDKALKDFILHYYRTPDSDIHVANGPVFLSFAPATDPAMPPQKLILFLIKEVDGRYAPVVGQTDPDGAVKELRGVSR